MFDIFDEPNPAPSGGERGMEGDGEREKEGEREREREGETVCQFRMRPRAPQTFRFHGHKSLVINSQSMQRIDFHLSERRGE
jgi:hypothetical protein